MLGIALVFVIVFLLNLIPAFAPPTWMVFSYIGFRYPTQHVTVLAMVGAVAATSGRLLLAKFSRLIIRQKLLSEETKQNIDAIREGLQDKRKLTSGVFLFYAFSPLPSNYVFIAYGLTNLELRLIALPFFIGRSVSYSLWGHGSSVLGRWAMDSSNAWPYLSVYFIASQVVLLYVVYLFTRIDWRLLFAERRLRKLPRGASRDGVHDSR